MGKGKIISISTVINAGVDLRSMNKIDINRDVIPLKFAVFSSVLFILLVPITTIAAFASTESSIFEIQRLLNLTNTSLMRGDLDSSLELLNNALDMVQELNE